MIIDRPAAGDIPALRSLWQAAFGDTDSFLEGFFATGFAPERCRCVHLGNTLAAALYWFDWTWQNKKVAYIYAVATDKAFRGQGLCRALMTDTHRHLQENGYAGACLVPGNPGLFAMYEKLGYRGFCREALCTVTAGAPTAQPERISWEEFQRRPMPDNALIPDGITLRFLATFAGLYRLKDGYFAVSWESGGPVFQEFLADPALLPGIIATLGAQTGTVRLPGADRYFALYLPLDGTEELPQYPGIPLM